MPALYNRYNRNQVMLVGFRIPDDEVSRAFIRAAGSLGVTKSAFVRALILQALRDEAMARAAVDAAGLNPLRPAYPRFISKPGGI
jgi:hypothetical protein